MKKLYFYTTEGCHLCELAAKMLDSHINQLSYNVETIDIAESESLVSQYGTRIPVLIKPKKGEELNWPFTELRLVEWLQELD